MPAGQVDVTAPVTVDGLSYIAPDDPAMPMYRVIANNRQPVALRDLMIQPVRSGYIGDGHQSDPALVPPTGAQAVPDVDVDQVYLPARDGVARCQLYRPKAAPGARTGIGAEQLPVIVYYHGGGFTVGVSEDCDFLARKLAFTNSALVVSANYRSAPEFMFLYAKLATSGATVVTTMFPDITAILPVGRLIAGRVRRVNGVIRTGAQRYGFRLVDLHHAESMREHDTWSADRVHGSAKGHRLFAAAAAEALGLPGSDHSWASAGACAEQPSFRSRAASQVSWTRNMFVPHLWGNLRGVSSGDGLARGVRCWRR